MPRAARSGAALRLCRGAQGSGGAGCSGAVDSRVEEFRRAPAASAMFVFAARRGLDADRLVEPMTATAVTSTALRDLNPWIGAAAAHRARVLDAVRALRALVSIVLTDPRNAGWSVPLHRTAQLLLTGRDDPRHDPIILPVPAGPIQAWESYAQRPRAGITTSTSCRCRPSPPSAAAPTRSWPAAAATGAPSTRYARHAWRSHPPPASTRSTPPRTGTTSCCATAICVPTPAATPT